MDRLVIFGLGYCGAAIAGAARAAGFDVIGTSRARLCCNVISFDAAEPIIHDVTHVLTTIPPDASGDPVLARYTTAIGSAPRLRWMGYLSSTVVYGDRDGHWVDEDTPPAPSQPRGQRRLNAEQAWARFGNRFAVDIFRLAGVYGPGRSALADLRAGRARRIIKPDHCFGRIHRDDVARASLAAMLQHRSAGVRVLHLADDEPAASADVVTEAAALLGTSPPPVVSFVAAAAAMSPMAQSFWAENRRVASQKTQATLGLAWLYPTFREGLRATLAQEDACARITDQGLPYHPTMLTGLGKDPLIARGRRIVARAGDGHVCPGSPQCPPWPCLFDG